LKPDLEESVDVEGEWPPKGSDVEPQESEDHEVEGDESEDEWS
jgi:hypothetical protein